MTIERFEVPGLSQYSYVVSDGGVAAVIDPLRDVDRYLEYAERLGLRITHVLETHIHADFAAGSLGLVEATGTQLAVSAYDEGERYRYAMPHRALADGDSIEIGSVRLQALHTPGHTPEHLSFLLFEGGGSGASPMAMFSGDFLFAGSLGRPDLLGEAAKLGLAHQLYSSVQALAELPDALAVYPGHGAGSLCGSGISGRAESTLQHERAVNPFFGYSEDEFVKRILASVPPLPDYYPRMKELNALGAPALHSLPAVKALSPDQVANLPEPATLLDVRSVEAFAAAHVAGAINMGTGGNLSLWAGWVLDPERPIVLIADGNEAEARLALMRVGLDRIVGHLEGGMPPWIAAGGAVARTAEISVADASQELGEAALLDVRDDHERSKGSIAGSLHVTLGELKRSLALLPKDRPIITVCESGYRSSIAASLLEGAGFEGVSIMVGGMGAWTRAELPVL
jgi:hydroxyacylglutathione hydrolase